MWTPPVTDEALQTRRSALGEAADLLVELVSQGARTICFIKSRKAVELVAKIVTDRLADDALELGIDIGALDACVVVTFPGTVASLRQMWGRAGRRGRGLAVYVAGEDALDQFFCRHPDDFLERPVEAAIVWHENEPIHLAHLLCAAHEGPLDAADAEVLGTVEAARAHSTVHDGAIYLHLGRAYEVRDLDLDARRALVTPFDGNWYTQPKKETDMEIERLLDRRSVLGVTLGFGTVTVTEEVHAYQRKRLPDHEVIDLLALDLPPQSFRTQALWYEVPDDLLHEFPRNVLLGALH